MRTVTMRGEPAPTVAVNDAIIANTDIAREVQNHAGATPRQGWQDATRALVVREMLLQRARALNVVAQPLSQDGARETDEEALISALLAAEVTTPKADGASCRRYYQANLKRFRSPDLFEPLHILFKAPRDDATAFTQAVARAETVLAEVNTSPGRFESLATALSNCSSATDGGRIGQIAPGETTPEFETALNRRKTPGVVPWRNMSRCWRARRTSPASTCRVPHHPWCNRKTAMLGQLLQALSDPDGAEAVLARVGTQEIRQRVERAAAAKS